MLANLFKHGIERDEALVRIIENQQNIIDSLLESQKLIVDILDDHDRQIEKLHRDVIE